MTTDPDTGGLLDEAFRICINDVAGGDDPVKVAGYLLALVAEHDARLRADLAACREKTLTDAADEIAHIRDLTNGGINGFSELIAWPGSKTVEDWLRARAKGETP